MCRAYGRLRYMVSDVSVVWMVKMHSVRCVGCMDGEDVWCQMCGEDGEMYGVRCVAWMVKYTVLDVWRG